MICRILYKLKKRTVVTDGSFCLYEVEQKLICSIYGDKAITMNKRKGPNELKEIADTIKATKELMLKVNSLRQQAGLSAIEN